MIYELGHIYVIWDIEDHNLIYYGSTKDFRNRMHQHKFKNNACSSRQIIERGNYEYAILETYENIDEYDLVERERWYILNKPCVNKIVPHRTGAEWRQDNKQEIADYHSEYYQNNKKKRNEYSKEYCKDYYVNNKDKINNNAKEYYYENKTKVNDYQKKYREKNKHKTYQRITCKCGCVVSKINLNVHMKSKKHIRLIENLV
jgi:hypothetical protein